MAEMAIGSLRANPLLTPAEMGTPLFDVLPKGFYLMPVFVRCVSVGIACTPPTDPVFSQSIMPDGFITDSDLAPSEF